MAKKRKTYELSNDGKFNKPILTHMRDMVFGKKAILQVHKVVNKLPTDEELRIQAAAEKRLRKAQKRVK